MSLSWSGLEISTEIISPLNEGGKSWLDYCVYRRLEIDAPALPEFDVYKLVLMPWLPGIILVLLVL